MWNKTALGQIWLSVKCIIISKHSIHIDVQAFIFKIQKLEGGLQLVSYKNLFANALSLQKKNTCIPLRLLGKGEVKPSTALYPLSLPPIEEWIYTVLKSYKELFENPESNNQFKWITHNACVPSIAFNIILFLKRSFILFFFVLFFVMAYLCFVFFHRFFSLFWSWI